jgi:hypothetical protein
MNPGLERRVWYPCTSPPHERRAFVCRNKSFAVHHYRLTIITLVALPVQLYMECMPGECPSLKPGERFCLNMAIQQKRFPGVEVFEASLQAQRLHE